MIIEEAVQRLITFIESLPDFRVYEQHEIDTYDHMGAAIADAVLQAQRDYDSVVAKNEANFEKVAGCQDRQ